MSSQPLRRPCMPAVSRLVWAVASAVIEFIDWRKSQIAGGEAGTEVTLLRQTRALLVRRRGNVRYEALLDRVRAGSHERAGKSVVFTGFSTTATEVGEVLGEQMGARHVALHVESMTSAEQDEAVRRFVHDPAVTVLVCDASGEEGRNLQTASQIIHLDLPLSVEPTRAADRTRRPLQRSIAGGWRAIRRLRRTRITLDVRPPAPAHRGRRGLRPVGRDAAAAPCRSRT